MRNRAAAYAVLSLWIGLFSFSIPSQAEDLRTLMPRTRGPRIVSPGSVKIENVRVPAQVFQKILQEAANRGPFARQVSNVEVSMDIGDRLTSRRDWTSFTIHFDLDQQGGRYAQTCKVYYEGLEIDEFAFLLGSCEPSALEVKAFYFSRSSVLGRRSRNP